MASEIAALAIYLDAPLQSWGVSSRFQRRGTESAPSKSGVLGLIAAAMGIDKHDPDESERLAPLSACRFSVFPVAKGEKPAPVLRLEDFHTVGGGYDRDDPLERLHIARKASGGPSTTIITRRFYLEQARFVAVLEGDSGILPKAASALEDPVWGVWFGRKCCLPASPLLPTLALSISEALDALLQKTGSRIIGEGRSEQDGEGAWHHPDQPVSFGRREFLTRPVSRHLLQSHENPA
jgi:CRISPR system Cascade subunit CasD